MIIRKCKLNVRLSERKRDELKRKSRKAGFTVSTYIRMLIKGNEPKAKQPSQISSMIMLWPDIYDILVKSGNKNTAETFSELLFKVRTELIMPDKADAYGND